METEKKVFEPKRRSAERKLPWKRIVIAAVALLLAVALTVGLILAFRPQELVVSYRGVGLDAEMYALWYTILKSQIMDRHGFKSSDDWAATWDKPCILEGKTDKTWGEVLDAEIREAIKIRLVAAALFDEMGLTLTSGQRARIKSYYDNMMEYRADSAAERKAILARHKSSPAAASRCAVLDMKADLLYYHMALGKAEYMTTEELNSYYLEHYYRVKIVYINDEYYRDFVDGEWVKVPLDTSVVGPGAQNSDDLAALNGYLSDGIPGTLEEKLAVFETFLSRSDEGLHTESAYPSGLYLDGKTDHSISGFLEKDVAAILLKDPPAPGELRRVVTEDGVRFIMGYPLDGAAFDRPESSVFFKNFYSDVAELAVTARARARLDEVTVDMRDYKLDMYTIPYNDKNLYFCVVE